MTDEDIKFIFESLSEAGLPDHTELFINDLKQFYEKRGYLTDDQLAALTTIYKDNCDEEISDSDSPLH